MRQRLLAGVGVMVMVIATVLAPPQEIDAQQALRLPFPEGAVRVNADEVYRTGATHPSIGAFALDLVPSERASRIVETPVLAIGAGRVQIACVHHSGSAILRQEIDGYSGEFFYVHIDIESVPSRFTEAWTRVEQGDVLGRLFPEAISGIFGEPCFQISDAPHLHLDFPREGVRLDGTAVGTSSPNRGDVLTSTNVVADPGTVVRCDGHRATIIGTPGDDSLVGTDGRDVIAGLQGDDQIIGLEGDDILCGGRGDDRVVGGLGFDLLFGAQGDDVLVAANGSEPSQRMDVRGARMFGGLGNDVLFGSNRWDRMQGGGGADQLFGFEGRDWVRGGEGPDLIRGGPAVDDLRGGPGKNSVTQ